MICENVPCDVGAGNKFSEQLHLHGMCFPNDTNTYLIITVNWVWGITNHRPAINP